MDSAKPIYSQQGIHSEKLLDRIARKYVHKLFNSLLGGRLTVIENGEEIIYGQTENKPGDIEALILVKNNLAYRKMFLGGSTGGAEAYIENMWGSPDLLEVIRLMSRNLESINSVDKRRLTLTGIIHKMLTWKNNNSLKKSRENIAAHYDLSNTFFSNFLSDDMMYSAAMFNEPGISLEEASTYKLDNICKKLELCASDHLLEIGSGWGGMAIHAAKFYGCRVTTTTISNKQFEFVKNRVIEVGLQDKITVLNMDYRLLSGKYSKLVSIEMIEAVGYTHYKSYFSICNSLLEPEGLMLIQAITVPDQRYTFTRDNIDFIKKYIFPGGCLPSNEEISRCVSKYTEMRLIGVEDITEDYAITLRKWRDNFNNNIGNIEKLGFDKKFQRMWNYYFSYCEGGFKERAINTAQYLLAKNK